MYTYFDYEHHQLYECYCFCIPLVKMGGFVARETNPFSGMSWVEKCHIIVVTTKMCLTLH